VAPASGDYDFSQLTGQVGATQLVGSYPSAFTAPLGGSANYIQNGTTQQTGTSFNIDGSGTAALLNASIVNATTNYQINGTTILASLPVNGSLFVGDSVAASGNSNTFLGSQAGQNSFGGNSAGNTFVGAQAGQANTQGFSNVFVGSQAGKASTTGLQNTYVGAGVAPVNNSSRNTFVGKQAGLNATATSDTILIGYLAGVNITTGISNIDIGSPGGVGTENNTLRIGNQGTGLGQQNQAFIAGITSQTITTGNPVWVDANGKLGIGSGGSGVTSFNGRTGAVVSASNDYSFSQLSGTASVSQIPSLASLYIQNSTSQQTGTNFNVSGNGTVGGTLTGTTAVNTTGTYQISGATVLATGTSSVAVGNSASVAAQQDVFIGASAGNGTSTGSSSVYVGYQAGKAITNGSGNVAIGVSAGVALTSGSNNTYVGILAGQNANTNNNDIYIVNTGVAAENNTIRIGTQGTGNLQQNRTFIAGITGATSSGGINVLVNSSGQLGTTTSSRRYKDNITDMGSASSKLFQLRPVTFFYKPQFDDGSHLLQYGLIAEEVAKVFPDLVVYGEDGQPQTVRYHLLTPMLLNELQKQHAVAAAQEEVIKTQQKQIEDLQQRLTRLEAMMNQQMQAVSQK
jgi:hypothetical protein